MCENVEVAFIEYLDLKLVDFKGQTQRWAGWEHGLSNGTLVSVTSAENKQTIWVEIVDRLSDGTYVGLCANSVRGVEDSMGSYLKVKPENIRERRHLV